MIGLDDKHSINSLEENKYFLIIFILQVTISTIKSKKPVEHLINYFVVYFFVGRCFQTLSFQRRKYVHTNKKMINDCKGHIFPLAETNFINFKVTKKIITKLRDKTVSFTILKGNLQILRWKNYVKLRE